jgi:hypothetical protein
MVTLVKKTNQRNHVFFMPHVFSQNEHLLGQCEHLKSWLCEVLQQGKLRFCFVILEKMKVASEFIGMMKIMFQDIKTSIFFNGSTIESFKVEIGVRHGCFLSPYLLILMGWKERPNQTFGGAFSLEPGCQVSGWIFDWKDLQKHWVLEYLSFTFNR